MTRRGLGSWVGLVVALTACGQTRKPPSPVPSGGAPGSGGSTTAAAGTAGAPSSDPAGGQAGEASAPLPPGSACQGAEQCESGSCVDGHCCAEDCAVCEACTGPAGTCEKLGLRQEDAHPEAACSDDHWCVEQGVCEQKAQVVVGDNHTCALLTDGNVRCWGYGYQLGRASLDDIGDSEPASASGNLDIGGRVVELAAGLLHTCALLDTGMVRCWGSGFALGYGGPDGQVGEDIGDDETPASAGPVPLAGKVLHIAANHVHTCALIEGGAVFCWGDESSSGGMLGDLALPSSASRIAVGRRSSCGISSTGTLNCVGTPASEQTGVTQASLGLGFGCGLFDDTHLRCWGESASYEAPVFVAPSGYDGMQAVEVDVGSPVKLVAAADSHLCAVDPVGTLRCWGHTQSDGNLGRPGTDFPFADPAALDVIKLGGAVEKLSLSNSHSCALLADARIRCWGANYAGQLGYGHSDTIGDNETPASAGDVPYLD